MSEARTPEEDTIKPQDDEPVDEEYDGPDPEDDSSGGRVGRGSGT